MITYSDIEILLVEDNPADAELTLRALKQSKLANRVTRVSDGTEALDFIFARGAFSYRRIEDTPKLILLDLKLPKVDGLQVLHAIKNNPRTQALPVVVLTSSNQDQDIAASYRLGANSYIVKPVDFDKFVAAVRGIGLYWLMLNQSPTLP